MLHSLTELLNAPLDFQDGKAFLREVFFEPATGQIRLVAVETGHPDRFEALIDASRLSTPVKSGGDWTLQVTGAELAEAPNWPEAMEQGWLDPYNWPLILIGPFAGPIVPALAMSSLGLAMAEDTPEEQKERNEADRLVEPLERAGDWLGAAVFGWDGELGRIEDLRFEPATRTIREFRLTIEGQKEEAALPLTGFRHRSETGAHLVVDAHRGDLQARAAS